MQQARADCKGAKCCLAEAANHCSEADLQKSLGNKEASLLSPGSAAWNVFGRGGL